jgi:hypothetical protein
LAQAAGGPTATATRAAADVARRDVSRATGPARESALERANIAGREVPRAEQLAAQARAQADEQSGLARRMTFGAERAETRLGQMDLGDAFDPAAVGRERGIAGAMTQRGEQAARGAIGLRQSARDLEDYVADLAAQVATDDLRNIEHRSAHGAEVDRQEFDHLGHPVDDVGTSGGVLRQIADVDVAGHAYLRTIFVGLVIGLPVESDWHYSVLRSAC